MPGRQRKTRCQAGRSGPRALALAATLAIAACAGRAPDEGGPEKAGPKDRSAVTSSAGPQGGPGPAQDSSPAGALDSSAEKDVPKDMPSAGSSAGLQGNPAQADARGSSPSGALDSSTAGAGAPGSSTVTAFKNVPKDRSQSASESAALRPLPEGLLGFRRACEARERVVIGAVGDLLIHHELQIQATRSELRFRALWAGIEDLLGVADVMYANLEVPLAAGVVRSGEPAPDPGLVFDRKVYTGYPRFNVHPSLAEDLARAGVDVVSTGNNHALDRGPLGVDKTVAALKAAKLPHTGTRARGETGPWHTLTRANNFTIAWLSCTLHTNRVPDPDGQVPRCFDSKTAVAEAVRALAQTRGIDAVIVTPHWGKEYAPTTSKQQDEFARRWAEAGATAIVGSHPHVLQPWQTLTTSDGREVLVAYSLGNFLSHQPELERRSTAIVYIGLARGEAGPAFVYGAGYVPLHVRQTGDEFFVEAIDRVGAPADARAHVVKMFGPANLIALKDADTPHALRQRLAAHCAP